METVEPVRTHLLDNDVSLPGRELCVVEVFEPRLGPNLGHLLLLRWRVLPAAELDHPVSHASRDEGIIRL